MQTSKKGIEFIVKEEGLVLSSYLCPAGVLTIGVGHTGKDVKKGMTITKEKALELLENDLQKFENAVNKYVITDLKQHEFDALVSFAFNVGTQAFKNSTLLKRINNNEDTESIKREFYKWKYGGGKVLPVLVARRKREYLLFKEGIYE